MPRKNVTVVVGDLNADGGEHITIVFESHLEHPIALKRARKIISQGWADNHAIPNAVADIIACAYEFNISWSFLYTPEMFND